eukprot:CAMPEP_0170272248 /NCGR_PEP_ID=MMETSP0116_2-20130129/36076_1 /TAXON_ID=400756 /ORGANISM="Durinskia baltica, Strain CSIRO CS-38" /LENGTH=168 /DNA_ID=CAMNT_0010523455 /DNA_START=52 /DNA_END=555 /DNA_ORIENTATION=-
MAVRVMRAAPGPAVTGAIDDDSSRACRSAVGEKGGDELPSGHADTSSTMLGILPDWLANVVDSTTAASDPPAEHRSDAAATASISGSSNAAEATGSLWAFSDDEGGRSASPSPPFRSVDVKPLPAGSPWLNTIVPAPPSAPPPPPPPQQAKVLQRAQREQQQQQQQPH